MAQSNDSIKKVLMVAFALCLVCSVVVSTAAVTLRPMQQLNEELDRKTNILRVANLYEPGMDVEAAFGEITPRDRKSTRLNSSHVAISYAVFCLKKKIIQEYERDDIVVNAASS